MRRAVANNRIVLVGLSSLWIFSFRVVVYKQSARQKIIRKILSENYRANILFVTRHELWLRNSDTMFKLMGAKRKERDKLEKSAGDKKWWKFSRKTKVKPMRHLDIQHNVDFNQNHDGESESYEMSKYLDRDNNHYRWVSAFKYVLVSCWVSRRLPQVSWLR